MKSLRIFNIENFAQQAVAFIENNNKLNILTKYLFIYTYYGIK